MPPRVRIAWERDGRSFEAVEPDADLVERHAEALRDWYNADDNASMMDGSGAMSREDVVDFWRELRDSGGRGFLGFCDGELVGDCDLRGLSRAAAEFAIMVGAASQKGKGIGRALALMTHVFAFRDLRIAHLYVPPRRDNHRVHALNAFLGYTHDGSEPARRFADGPESETYSLPAERFHALHGRAWDEIAVSPVALTVTSWRATASP